MKNLIALALLLVSQLSYATETVIKWGFEKNVIAEGTGNAERSFAAENLHALGDSPMFIKSEAGFWVARDAGRRSSFYSAVSWGYRVRTPLGLFFEGFIGPGYVSVLDTQLGSHLEIVHDLNAGFIDYGGWGIGAGFKHISNAGLAMPNRGRDFFSIRFLIPIL